VHKQSVDGAFDAAEKPLDFGGEREAFRISGGTLHT
jgi:hypothetical protein